ncbi:MAG: fatty acid desaturase [Pirellulales bacterium]
MYDLINGRAQRPGRRRHRFAPDILKRVKDKCVLDNWHAIVALIYIWAFIGTTVSAPYLLEPWLNWWVVYSVCVVLMGFWMRGLATLLHEGAHFVLAKNAVVNFLAATVGSGYLIFHAFFPYRISHLNHHIYLGNEGKDPDLMFLIAQGVNSAKSRADFIWKFLISPLLMFRTPAKIVDLLRYRFFAKEEPLAEKLGKGIFLAFIIGLLIYLGLGRMFFWMWLVPLITTFPLVAWYVELMEHFPLVWESDIDLYMTRNRWTDPATRFFLGMFNENYHQTHHLFPQCPFWRLPEVHKILMEDEEYRNTQFREVGLVGSIIEGTPSILTSIVERRHRTA